jgi:hypothetical protein
MMFRNNLTRFAVAGVLGFCFGISCTLSGRAEAPKTAASVSASPVKRSFAPASIRALPGLQCKLYPAGSAPSSGILVFTDDDGYARFQAVKMTVGDAVQRLILDCTDTTGKPSTYSVDLTSDETFAPHPINLANERGADRPALSGDPLSYTQSQLLKAGYGLRPDPVANAPAYARWLASASKPGRFLQTTHSDSISHSEIPQQPQQRPKRDPATPANVGVSSGSPWYGAVMTAAPQYTFTEATFNIPTAIPGGDGTGNTKIYIWNGLGGWNTGSGLIQFFAIMTTSPTAASYWTKREYCCGDNQFTSDAGYFAPNPNDVIYDEAWYCDANGNQDINGGYGCAFFHDMTSGAIVSCTTYPGSPCSSVKAFPLCSASPTFPGCMTLGQSAEFIIENGGGLTDFSPAVKMVGSATGSAGQVEEVNTDPVVTLLTDTSATSHSAPYMAVGVAQAATCFTVSDSFSGAIGPCTNACPPGETWIPKSAACGPPAAACTIKGVCASAWEWQYSVTCTGMDVGIVYNGGCTAPTGESENCYAGFDGSSTVSASWGGAPGPPTWYTLGQQASPTVCTSGSGGQENCYVYTISGLPACPNIPSSPPPLCPDGEKYCTKFSPPMCVPAKLCLVEPVQP